MGTANDSRQTFLAGLADRLIDRYGVNFEEVAIVVPNRRAGVFLRRDIALRAGKKVWSPALFAVEDFIMELSGFSPVDSVEQIFEIYAVHQELEGSEARSFEDFCGWGQSLLSDFNELDFYLVDAEKMFGYLNDARAIDMWNVSGESLTPFEKQYLKFYRSLYQYYLHFKERLAHRGLAYQGMAYRYVAEHWEEVRERLKYKHWVLAGFNALTTAEEKLFRIMESEGLADIIWDADRYYLDDPMQEAGRFLREWTRNKPLGEPVKPMDGFGDKQKQIRCVGVPQNVGQARVVGSLLRELSVLDIEKEQAPYLVSMNRNRFNLTAIKFRYIKYVAKEQNRTAVVLADENLLFPILNSIPEEYKKFNVTMGYPMKQSAFYTLVEAVMGMYENVERRMTDDARATYYFRDLLLLLSQPVMSILGPGEQSKVIKAIKTQNNTYYSVEELMEVLHREAPYLAERIGSLFFSERPVPAKVLGELKYLVDTLRDELIGEGKGSVSQENALQLEFLFHFARIFHRLTDMLNRYHSMETIQAFRSIYRQIAASSKIAFYGEPLEGLQIMGMLETRTLDFDNVILISANEEKLPSGKSGHSFIPLEIKRQFGMPTYQENNAVFAYHFYRLLQRANNVCLIYNTEPDELAGGDRSRFVTQLIHEWPVYNKGSVVKEEVVSLAPKPDMVDRKITIEMSDDIHERLKKRIERGLAPTNLNVYINCPLQFYFREIAAIPEVEQVEETIEANTLGTVVHEVLENFFKPFLHQNIFAEDVQHMKKKVDDEVKLSFERNYSGGDFSKGKNLIILHVAKRFIRNFLKMQLDELKLLKSKGESLFIEGLEERYKMPFNVEVNGETQVVYLKGTVDRIDRIGDVWRIIDYKTGVVEPRDLKFSEWNELLEEPKKSKCFQLLMYAWLFFKEKGIENCMPGIISLRRLSQGVMLMKGPGGVDMNRAVLDEFSVILNGLIKNVLGDQGIYEQVGDEDRCKYCPYSSICGR